MTVPPRTRSASPTHSLLLLEYGPRAWEERFDRLDADREQMTATGQALPNRMTFLAMKAPELLVFDHSDDDSRTFRMTITFDSQRDGKTVVTLRQLHPTKAHREAGIRFGAVEVGNTTMDEIEAQLRNLER